MEPAVHGTLADTPAGSSRARSSYGVALLGLALAATSAAVYFAVVEHMPDYDERPLPWLFFAVAFGLAEIGRIRFSVRGHPVQVSLATIPLVIGFYFAVPAELVLGQLVGSTIALVLVRREAPAKLAFTAALSSLATSLATVLFRVLAPPSLDDVIVWWLASFAGTVGVVLLTTPAMAAAGALANRRVQAGALAVELAFGVVAAAVNTSLALLAVVFLNTNPQDLWLALLPAIVLGLGYRAYVLQRDRQGRIEFLYECARLLQGSFVHADTLGALLGRTREMLHAEVAEIVMTGGPDSGDALVARIMANGVTEQSSVVPHDVLANRLALLGPGRQGTAHNRPVRDRELAERLRRVGLADGVVVPLRADSGVVGTLMVGNRDDQREPFSGEDLRVLETLGVHLAAALRNSRLVERLAESLANVTQLAAAVEASDDAILAVDTVGTITAWNPAAERLTGYRDGTLAGIPVRRLVPPYLSEEDLRAFGLGAGDSTRRRGASELVRRDGSLVPVSVTVSPITGGAAVNGGLSVIVHDETVRTASDAALRESVERFRRVFQGSPIGMALADRDLRWTAVNEALCRILGRREEELLGRRFDAFIHPDDVAGANRMMEEMDAEDRGPGFSSERRYISGDDRIIWARVTSRPLRDDQTGQARLVCMIQDITETRSASLRLRDTEARLHRAVVAFTAVREPASVLRAVLAAARDLLDAEFAAIGVLAEDGSAIAEFHFDGIDEGTAAAIGAIPSGQSALSLANLASGPTRIRDVRAHPLAIGVPAGHPVITSFVAVPIVFEGRLVARLYAGNKRTGAEFDADDEGVATALAAQAAVVLENARINARTQALIEELDRVNAGLRKANDAKSEFLGTISHELRTPLHSILVAAELVHDPVFGPLTEERARELGATIQGSGRHLLGLIDDLVDLSRIEADRVALRHVHLPASVLLEEVRHELAPLAHGRGITLEAAPAPDVLVYADPLRIRQVLINLLGNALKFAGHGGRVRIEASAAAGSTVIAVHDTGPGIADEDLDRIFEPFEQVSGMAATGAGLGLSIARRLVELHGGRLEVASTLGAGSTFTITIPAGPALHASHAPETNLPTAPEVSLSTPRSRILLVEDDATALSLLADLLQRSGHDVWPAADLSEARARLAVGTPSLVLLDIRLGGEDGLDLAREIRRHPATRHLPILALSADAMQHDRERAAEAGCDGHLAKPVNVRDLLEWIRRLEDEDDEGEEPAVGLVGRAWEVRRAGQAAGAGGRVA